MTMESWLGIVVPIIVLVVGAVIRHLAAELGKARATVEAQKVTIATQQRQLDRYDIVAEVQAKIFAALPPIPEQRHTT